MFNVIQIRPEFKFQKQRFFIDCPIDIEMQSTKCIRIEIPRYLARYITDLQNDNFELRQALADAQAPIEEKS